MDEAQILVQLIESNRETGGILPTKVTLRQHAVEMNPPPEMRAEDVLALRSRLNLSRALFARCLRTNIRTLENWEQGRARPNAQAVLLMQMVARFPDTIVRLAGI